MTHYAAINRDGFQGNATGVTPVQALETIIRDSSGPADYEFVAASPCNVGEPDSMSVYEMPIGWDGDTTADVLRDGVLVGCYQIVWAD